jgi:hypothetical protein
MVADALVLTRSPVCVALVSAEVTVPGGASRSVRPHDRRHPRLDGPPAVPAPGGLRQPDTFSFVADNQAKGISHPALTLHANADWSLGHWDDDSDAIAGR